ncbi:MAG: hypothetical protein P8N09_07505 [Planctomycetota bacterium]|nr:hypothetical protein [Planctomycetota bacterium]
MATVCRSDFALHGRRWMLTIGVLVCACLSACVHSGLERSVPFAGGVVRGRHEADLESLAVAAERLVPAVEAHLLGARVGEVEIQVFDEASADTLIGPNCGGTATGHVIVLRAHSGTVLGTLVHELAHVAVNSSWGLEPLVEEGVCESTAYALVPESAALQSAPRYLAFASLSGMATGRVFWNELPDPALPEGFEITVTRELGLSMPPGFIPEGDWALDLRQVLSTDYSDVRESVWVETGPLMQASAAAYAAGLLVVERMADRGGLAALRELARAPDPVGALLDACGWAEVTSSQALFEGWPEEMVEWTFLDAAVFDVLQKHLPPEVQAAPETYQLRASFTWPAGGPGGTELEKVVPIRNDGLLARRFAEVAEPAP